MVKKERPKQGSQLQHMHSLIKGCFDRIDGATEVYTIPENEARLIHLAQTGNIKDIKRYLQVCMLSSCNSFCPLSLLDSFTFEIKLYFVMIMTLVLIF